MEPNNTITKYYQFIGECLLFYFLLVLILTLLHYPIPFWGYLLTIAISFVLLSISLRLIKKHIIYVIDFSLLLLIMVYIIGFPLISSTMLALVMLWRFIVHENDAVVEKQLHLIRLMLFLFTFDILFFYDPKLIWIAVIFLFVMVIGYQLSQVFINGSTNVYKSLHFPIGFFCLVMGGSLLIFSFFQFSNITLASIWNKVVKLIMSIPIFQPKLELEKVHPAPLELPTVKDPTTIQQEGGVPEIFNWSIIAVILLAIIAIIVFLARKKVVQHVKSSHQKVFTSTGLKEMEETQRSNRKSLFRKHFSKIPTNHVRREVYRFEKLANRKEKGRERSETIEEWFARFNVDSSYLDLYQKIRYGSSELTEQQIKQFNKELRQIRETMNI